MNVASHSSNNNLNHYSCNNKINEIFMNSSVNKIIKAVRRAKERNACMSGKVFAMKISLVAQINF